MDNKDQFREKLEKSHQGHWIIDRWNHVVFVNRVACQQLGIVPEDVLYTSLPTLNDIIEQQRRSKSTEVAKTILEIDSRTVEWDGESAILVTIDNNDFIEKDNADEKTDILLEQAFSELLQSALKGHSAQQVAELLTHTVAKILNASFVVVVRLSEEDYMGHISTGCCWQHDQCEPLPTDWRGYKLTMLPWGGQQPFVIHETPVGGSFSSNELFRRYRISRRVVVPIVGATTGISRPWGMLMACSQGNETLDSSQVDAVQRLACMASQAIECAQLLLSKRDSKQFLHAIEETAQIGGWQVSLRRRRVHVSSQVAVIFGEGDQAFHWAYREVSERIAPAFRESIWRAMERLFRTGGSFDLEIETLAVKTEKTWVRVVGKAVYNDSGKIIGAQGSVQNITKIRLARDEVRFLGLYDPLTQLPNSRLLEDRIQQVVSVCKMTQRHAVLILVDVGNIRTHNAKLGHYRCDLFLQEVVRRLCASVRSVDTVARYDNHRFVVVAAGLNNHHHKATEQVALISEKLLAKLEKPYNLDHQTYSQTFSLGATLFGSRVNRIEGLVEQSELALTEAKKEAKPSIYVFNRSMHLPGNDRIELEKALQQGLDQEQFVPFYQPQIGTMNRVIGAEVLVRWNRPRHGLQLPGAFISVAEETGMMVQLGEQVLHQACLQLARWSADKETSGLKLSINISASQFHHDAFVSMVKKVLSHTGAHPANLMLEVTEATVLQNIRATIAKMDQLHADGVCFSLDNFGTGYSSLYGLKRLPLAQLKIDRSFVHRVDRSEQNMAVARSILALAKPLRLAVIAEGVETPAEYHFLMDAGCTGCQGYLFSHPEPIHSFEVFRQRCRFFTKDNWVNQDKIS